MSSLKKFFEEMVAAQKSAKTAKKASFGPLKQALTTKVCSRVWWVFVLIIGFQLAGASSEQATSAVAQCVASMSTRLTPAEVDATVKELERSASEAKSADAERTLALLVLAQIGKATDLSEHKQYVSDAVVGLQSMILGCCAAWNPWF